MSNGDKRFYLKMNERFQIQTDINNNRSKFSDMTLNEALAYFTEKYKYEHLTRYNLEAAAKTIGHKFKKRVITAVGGVANLNHAGLKARIEHLEKFCIENGMVPLTATDPGSQ